jgi:hypothetical protein
MFIRMPKRSPGIFLLVGVLAALAFSTTRARAGEASECDRRCNVDYGGGCYDNDEHRKEERECYDACLAED